MPEAQETPIRQTEGQFKLPTLSMVLSDRAEGFSFRTKAVLRRRDAGEELPLDDSQKEKLQSSMIEQMSYTAGNVAKEALNRHRDNPDNEDAKSEFSKRRKEYLDRFHPIVGLRDIEIDSNEIRANIRPVSFALYNNFGVAQSSEELLEISKASSTSLGIITADKKLIVQNRSPRNASYAGVTGASAAGYLEIKFKGQNGAQSREIGGELPFLETKDIKNSAIREMTEEIGIEEDDLSEIVIGGLMHESIRVHEEFALVAKSKLTADQIRKKAFENTPIHEQKFTEKFVFIPATPEAVSTLLTEVKCPIPPTHIATFVAAGYNLMLEREGKKAAQNWMKEIEAGIKENIQEIDSMVKKYYEDNSNVINQPTQRQLSKIEDDINTYTRMHPNATSEEIEKARGNGIKSLPERNLSGYSALYLPREQGLPGFNEALKRAGLI